MKTKNDGGPAFPHDMGHLDEPNTAGLSIRDYFAGKALPALIECSESMRDWKNIPKTAYEMADAMLVARDAE